MDSLDCLCSLLLDKWKFSGALIALRSGNCACNCPGCHKTFPFHFSLIFFYESKAVSYIIVALPLIKKAHILVNPVNIKGLAIAWAWGGESQKQEEASAEGIKPWGVMWALTIIVVVKQDLNLQFVSVQPPESLRFQACSTTCGS